MLQPYCFHWENGLKRPYVLNRNLNRRTEERRTRKAVLCYRLQRRGSHHGISKGGIIMLFCRAQMIKKLHTLSVKFPLRDHLKCEGLLVAFENRTTGNLFREEVLAHLLFGRQFIACSFQVAMCVVPCCSLKVFRTH